MALPSSGQGAAEAHRLQGNDLFGRQQFATARACYTEALKCEDISEEDRIRCLCNKATCEIALHDYAAALDTLDVCHHHRPLHAKAFALRGTALERLGNPDEAMQAYSTALVLDPAFLSVHDNIDALEKARLQRARDVVVRAAPQEENSVRGCVHETPGRGRSIVAAEALRMGDVVLPVSKPYTIALSQRCVLRWCGQCQARIVGQPVTCSTCLQAAYCGLECRDADDFHQHVCPSYARLKVTHPELCDPEWELCRHLILTVAKLQRQPVTLGGFDMRSMESHRAELFARCGVDAEASYVEEVQRLRRCCDIVTAVVGSDAVAVEEACGILSCNSFEWATFEGRRLGTVLYEAPVSLLNHSCAPTAVHSEDGRVRAIRPLQAGEEVTLSYIAELHLPTSRRQQLLASKYFFTCTCNRCKPQHHPPADSLMYAFCCMGANVSSSAAGSCGAALHFGRPESDDGVRQSILCGGCCTEQQAAQYFAQEAAVVERVERLSSLLRETADPSLADSLVEVPTMGLHPLHFMMKDRHNALRYAAAHHNQHEAVQCHSLWELQWLDCMMPLDFPLKAEAFLSAALSATRHPPLPAATAWHKVLLGHSRRRAEWPAERLMQQALALCVLTKGVTFTRRLCERHRISFDLDSPEAFVQ